MSNQFRKPTPIHAGRGLNLILSNWADDPVPFRGHRYATAEGAYQSWKSGHYCAGFENLSGASAKRLGYGQPVDKANNVELMRRILETRFAISKPFRDALANAGILSHPVNDRFWREVYPQLLTELRNTHSINP